MSPPGVVFASKSTQNLATGPEAGHDVDDELTLGCRHYGLQFQDRRDIQ